MCPRADRSPAAPGDRRAPRGSQSGVQRTHEQPAASTSSTAPPTPSSRRGAPPTNPAPAEETVAPARLVARAGIGRRHRRRSAGRGRSSYPQRATERRAGRAAPGHDPAPNRFRITDALIDGEYAVVVAEDELETKPNVATVIDLASGERFIRRRRLRRTDHDRRARGRSARARWLHATIGPGRAYCLASVDLATRTSDPRLVRPAAQRVQRRPGHRPPARPCSPSTTSARPAAPSPRWPASELTPFPDVSECTGWDGALLDGGAVWSVVPNENRIEAAHFFARVGDGYFDLGPGTSGSLAPVRGVGVLRARPPARRRPGPPDALVRGRRARGRLRDRQGWPGRALGARAAAATRSP